VMVALLIIGGIFMFLLGHFIGYCRKDSRAEKEIDHWKNEATSTGFLLEDANRRRIELEKENKDPAYY